MNTSEWTLVIGDKNKSSWSLRAWLPLKILNIPFREICIKLDQPSTKTEIAAISPSGRVPMLKHNSITVWDSLAICEYLNDCFPERHLWPQDRPARALARSISAEMHAGFAALRTQLPMHCFGADRRRLRRCDSQARSDIERLQEIWSDALSRYGGTEGFLFDAFSIADAMFAPVVVRFFSYGVELPTHLIEYCQRIHNLPALQEWYAGAKAE